MGVRAVLEEGAALILSGVPRIEICFRTPSLGSMYQHLETKINICLAVAAKASKIHRAAPYPRSPTLKQYVMPPHETIHAIYSFSEELFHALFCGTAGEIQEYWMHNGDHSDNFPEMEGSFHHTIPLRIYGDGADTTRNQHMEVLTLLPTLCTSSATKDSRILISVRSTVQTGNKALEKISTVISWSFEALRP